MKAVEQPQVNLQQFYENAPDQVERIFASVTLCVAFRSLYENISISDVVFTAEKIQDHLDLEIYFVLFGSPLHSKHENLFISLLRNQMEWQHDVGFAKQMLGARNIYHVISESPAMSLPFFKLD